MLMPSALNFVVFLAFFVIASYLWKMGASAILLRNPNSAVGKAMGAIHN
jgi:hypothetical protein